MGAERLLHESGHGAVVDAAIHCSFVAAGRCRDDVYAWFVPRIAGEWGGKKAYIERF